MRRPKAEVMAHWNDYAWPILQRKRFPQFVETMDQNFLYVALFYTDN